MAEFRPAIWIRNIALGGVILAFVFFFGQPSGTGGAAGMVARVGGEHVSRDVFEFFRELNERQSREFLPENLDADTVRELIDSRTLDGLVRRYIMAQAAEDLGLRVTDAEVRSEILSNEGLKVGGQFNRDLLERTANGLGGMREYSAEIRRDILLRKLQRLVGSPQRVSLEEAELRARRDLVQVRLRHVRVEPVALAAGSEVSGDEARALVDAEPERVEALYRRRRHEFERPERVRARHILFTGDEGAARARAALERLTGEDFEALALELSDDAATREEGGDLGFFPRGQVLPELEATAFGLDVGQTSQPFETERGVHLLRVEEREEATVRSLDEVRFELAREILLQDGARERARDLAETFRSRLAEGEPFDDLARELGLTVNVTPLFGWGDPMAPDLAEVEGIRATAFSLRTQAPVAPRLLAVGDAPVVVWLVERREAEGEVLADRARGVKERLEQEARARLLTLWYARRRQELQQSGDLEVYPLYPQG